MSAYPNVESTKIAYQRDGVIQVVGDSERVDVSRITLVTEDHLIYNPVVAFTERHGLREWGRESIPGDGWFTGDVEHLVYLRPEGYDHISQVPKVRDFATLFTTEEDFERVRSLSMWASQPMNWTFSEE